MGSRLFNFLGPIVRFFIPKLNVTWQVPHDGEPSVFVCNHDRSFGPLEMALNFPLDEPYRAWIYAAPLQRETTPAYIRQDNWWNKDSFLAPLYNAVIPPVVSWILPPILRSVPHIPVYHDARAVTTMKESLNALRKDGAHMIIFPEIPTGYGQHDTEKINEGFLNILPMYQKLTGKELKMWPVHMDRDRGIMSVRAPITMEPGIPLKDQIPDLSRKILAGIFNPDPE